MRKNTALLNIFLAFVMTMSVLTACKATATEYPVPETSAVEEVAAENSAVAEEDIATSEDEEEPTEDSNEEEEDTATSEDDEETAKTTNEEAEVAETSEATEEATKTSNTEEKEVETTESKDDVETADSAFDSVDAIIDACSVRAKCQDNRKACVVAVFSDSNPYDVDWDFGSKWNAYVDACDWSLVFDAEYYKKAYPMLAILYHNDDALLLRHFATVGVHEGRQGCENFNVEAYIMNMTSGKNRKAFSSQVEGAYIYYMLHYDTESAINTVTANDGTPVRTQIFNLYTWIQENELKEVNKYRSKVGAEDVAINGELCAFANYRAYINASGDFPNYGIEDYDGHKWAKEHNDLVFEYVRLANPSAEYIAENTVTGKNLQMKDIAFDYYCSASHYEAMVSTQYTLFGTSNVYRGSSYVGSVFDVYCD